MATQGLLLPIRFVDEHPAVSDAQRLEGSRFAGWVDLSVGSRRLPRLTQRKLLSRGSVPRAIDLRADDRTA
jgi:hypothetical protein